MGHFPWPRALPPLVVPSRGLAAVLAPAPALNTVTLRLLPFATLCCLLWGSAYPAIKGGYALLHIGRDDTAAQLVFAGWRFLLAGALLLAWGRWQGRRLQPPGASAEPGRPVWATLLALGLVQTSLQYVFFYVGLAHTSGVKASILNATGVFFSVLLAHVWVPGNRIDARKAMGCVVGFAGVMVVNLLGRSPLEPGVSLKGEGFVVLAALVLAAASLWGRRVSQRLDVLLMTGWQLALGGAVLLLGGLAAGGQVSGWGLHALALLGYMAVLSAVAFAVWAALLLQHPVAQVAVFNFLIPIFGALLSALFLGESVLQWRNALALVLVCAGIWLVTAQVQDPRCDNRG